VAGDPDITYDHYYNESWQVLEVRRSDHTSGPYEQYLWDIRYIDAPVLRWQDGNDDGDADDANETLYYTNDANMNVTALVNTSGTVLERVFYDPYGTPTFYDGSWQNESSESSYANEILYCGYRFDTETGLYHVRHRMYHPTLGRWLQRDPIGYADGMGLYEYVGNSPVTRTDPTGRIPVICTCERTQLGGPGSFAHSTYDITIESQNADGAECSAACEGTNAYSCAFTKWTGQWRYTFWPTRWTLDVNKLCDHIYESRDCSKCCDCVELVEKLLEVAKNHTSGAKWYEFDKCARWMDTFLRYTGQLARIFHGIHQDKSSAMA